MPRARYFCSNNFRGPLRHHGLDLPQAAFMRVFRVPNLLAVSPARNEEGVHILVHPSAACTARTWTSVMD
jgi:hypothetical protein